jgi:hypothetical protein
MSKPQKLYLDQSGNQKIGAIITERVRNNSADRNSTSCQSCGAGTTRADLNQITWSYYFVPNRALAVLVPIVTAVGAAFVDNYTREVRHETYHVLCANCAREARRDRRIGFLLRFLGLFVGILGLAATMAMVAWWFIADAHDRAMLQDWIPLSVTALVLGAVLGHLALRFSVPKSIRFLRCRPFHATSFKRVTNA